MAGKKKTPNGKWQYVFKRSGVLDRPLYLTFDSEEEGDAYAAKLDALLDRGIVPTDLERPVSVMVLRDLVSEYERQAHPSDKDQQALSAVLRSRGDTPLRTINAQWVDAWIADMKRLEALAPASIRARVGAVARCTDWGMRKGFLTLPDHPLRTLPDGYAQYSVADVQASGGVKREDVERDRRLEPGEHEAILAVIASGVLHRSHRPLAMEHPAAHRFLYVLAVESAMRLREMYTLTLPQIDKARRTVFLDRTKNGDKRQVPLSSVALAELEIYTEARTPDPDQPPDILFPWWDGTHDKRHLVAVSDYLSKRFAGVFNQAGAKGLRFHDLRHEATSRLFERTRLSEAQIMKITGHKSHRMMMRYANLRGSDLAAQLW
ncbi:site-specific integrase [Ideonella livida]|uniref:Site-specific integrase n=1 Tax=Ideonella livida TaxID=2707176 RepID=A0A7C9TGI8_9BURK|nr:site-specific integrase [Ideonella livida]NDY89779.1 site-specific integrase [Ideonella livida]